MHLHIIIPIVVVAVVAFLIFRSTRSEAPLEDGSLPSETPVAATTEQQNEPQVAPAATPAAAQETPAPAAATAESATKGS